MLLFICFNVILEGAVAPIVFKNKTSKKMVIFLNLKLKDFFAGAGGTRYYERKKARAGGEASTAFII